MNLMELKSTSQTRKVKNKYKIDDEPYQMSEYEWRGTLNEGELFLLVKYNLGAWKVKIAETEYELLYDVKYIYVAQEISPIRSLINKTINIDNLITYLQWK